MSGTVQNATVGSGAPKNDLAVADILRNLSP